MKWKTVPVIPNGRMSIAFDAAIRREAAKLDPSTTAHEPLEPLWEAVLAAAPQPPLPLATPSQPIPRTAAEAWNAGISTMMQIAARSAEVIAANGRRPLVEGFAIGALQQLAEDGAALLIPIAPPIAPASTAPVPSLYHQAQTIEVQ